MIRSRIVLKRALMSSRLLLLSSSSSSSSSSNGPVIQKPEQLQYVVEKTPITAALWSLRKNVPNVPNPATEDTTTSSATNTVLVVVEKTPKESQLQVTYNFKDDKSLRGSYVDSLGNILTGKLLEDLDALAGNVTCLHCFTSSSPTLSLVTASVDRIIQTKPIPANGNFILIGQTAWVGRSSLDVIIELHRADDLDSNKTDLSNLLLSDSPTLVLSSLFTFVARNTRTDKSVLINRLKPITSQEIALFNQREETAMLRKKKLLIPKTSEIDEKHFKRLMESGQAAEDMPSLSDYNSILMRKTQLENIFICQPQNVNTAGRIFGGFLMHRAYDLAHATCYSFAGVYPHFKEVDEILFKKPVDIGDLVRLKSRVVYTSNNKEGDNRPIVQIEVTCYVVKPESHSSYISNTFDFIFQFEDDIKPLKNLLPSTNAEARLLISAANNRSQ